MKIFYVFTALNYLLIADQGKVDSMQGFKKWAHEEIILKTIFHAALTKTTF